MSISHTGSTFPQDPRSKIWGYHFHMDIEEKDFPKALDLSFLLKKWSL